MLLKPLQVHTAWNIYQELQVCIMYCTTLEFINTVLTEIMCKQRLFKVVKYWSSASIHLVCSKIGAPAEWSLSSHNFRLYLMPWHQYMTNLLTEMIQLTYNHQCMIDDYYYIHLHRWNNPVEVTSRGKIIELKCTQETVSRLFSLFSHPSLLFDIENLTWVTKKYFTMLRARK